jgi:hypothetical protein
MVESMRSPRSCGARKASALGNKGLALRNRPGDKQQRSE